LKEIFDTSKAAKFIISMEVKGNYHEMQWDTKELK
jgi:hypothetical protein